MPHFDKIFRDAAFGDDQTPKGIEKTAILKSDAYYMDTDHPENTPDPLAKNAKAANKPGSSIPSIFGRMMFFKTALKNARISGVGGVNTSVYDKIVSQWLDLMEGIFTRSHNYIFTPWNKEDQLERLNKNHKILRDTLKSQMDKYFEDRVTNIYIIKDKDGELVGATSPYTLLFTSPNYQKDKQVDIVPLLQRKKGFRIFMYHLYTSLKSNPNIPKKIEVKQNSINGILYEEVDNPTYKMVSDLISYLERNFDAEDEEIRNEISNTITDTFSRLSQYYEPIKFIDGNIMKEVDIVNMSSISETKTGDIQYDAGPLKLYERKACEVDSDFFIDADKGKVADNTPIPMILPNVAAPKDREGCSYTTMRYIDDDFWKSDVLKDEFYTIENNEEVNVELPGGDGVQYRWLSAAAFLEDKLIKLPYQMDSSHFKNVINVGLESYLLPIKPKALKYLNLETVLKGRHGQGKGFQWHYDSSRNVISCRLDIPVKDKNNIKRTYVTLEKEYVLNSNDIVSASPNLGHPVSVGISPFVRIDKEKENRYDVMLHNGELENDPVQSIDIDFFNNSEIPLSKSEPSSLVLEFPTLKASSTVMQKLYKIKGATFDCLQIRYNCGNEGMTCGLVIPTWKTCEVKDTGDTIYYAIDFGTTNTHIAYVASGVNAQSFSTEELKNQVVYLAKKENISDKQQYLTNHTEKQLETACSNIYGDDSLATQHEQARRFFPNFELDQFAFPIRTASYGIHRDKQELFDGYSIGFNYPHEQEKTFLKFYNTKLKWNLERNNPTAEEEAKLFFKELLLIVRNHWLTLDGSNLTKKPRLALTFPLALKSDSLFQLWADVYAETFGINANVAKNDYLVEVSESLAPAHKLISDGTHKTSGLLNVDIGGGTTDIQYYRESHGRTLAFYNSEKFAGDDLWGCGRENLNIETNINDNLFTRYADVVMKGRNIQIGTTSIEYDRLKDLTGKEKIGRLLRDSNTFNFAGQIHNSADFGRNTPALKVVFLHYAALIFHIAKWTMGDPRMNEKFPELINFSGFGSKYIQILFGRNNNDELTEYTKSLLKAYGIKDIDNLKVKFAQPNPKGVTAEGAAIYAKNMIDKVSVVKPFKVYHYGYAECNPKNSPTYGEAADNEIADSVMRSFDEYLEGFDKVQSEGNFDIPSLSDAEKIKFREAAQNGYREIANGFLSGPAKLKDIKVLQSLFFWTLKDALYNFDTFSK